MTQIKLPPIKPGRFKAHFDEIIKLNKKLVEELNMEDAISVRTSCYDFSESAALTFLKSHEHVAIQVADILAGMAMRYLQENIAGTESSLEIVKAYEGILRISNPPRGIGINLVTTSKMHYELHY